MPDTSPAPVFSVLVPCRNAGPFIEEAVRSALDQFGPDDQLIVQDACSDDGTTEILQRVAAEDSRLRLVVERDGGQSDGLNRALDRAVARDVPSWVIWLNADDRIEPGALDAVRAAIGANPDVDLFYGSAVLLDADGSVVYRVPAREITVRGILRRGICSFSGSIVVRAGTLRDLGGLHSDIHYVMDLELQVRMARADLTQMPVDVTIGSLRFHDQSKSGTAWRSFRDETAQLRRETARTPAERLDATIGHARHLASMALFKVKMSGPVLRLRRRGGQRTRG